MIQKPATNHLQARWIVLVNLRAGDGRYLSKWPALRLRIEKLLPRAQIQVTKNTGEVREFLNTALSEGTRHVLAVGGDGTAHQVVNAIMRQNTVPAVEIVFTLFPLGTGNDWVKTHGIPTRWDCWTDYLRQAQPQQQSLGYAEYLRDGEPRSSYFLNVAGLAYDAFVVKALAEKQSRLPAKIYYLWSVLRCLLSYTPQRARLRFNEQVVEEAFYTINLGACRYSGGGMQFVPQADPSAPDLGLTYVRGMSPWAVLLNSYRFYGGHVATFHAATLTKTSTLWIEPLDKNEPLLLEADGEFLGQCPARISAVPAALTFLSRRA
ncbi:MAG: diacylglycerol kinase family protein [Bacteroidota bacterium]